MVNTTRKILSGFCLSKDAWSLGETNRFVSTALCTQTFSINLCKIQLNRYFYSDILFFYHLVSALSSPTSVFTLCILFPFPQLHSPSHTSSLSLLFSCAIRVRIIITCSWWIVFRSLFSFDLHLAFNSGYNLITAPPDCIWCKVWTLIKFPKGLGEGKMRLVRQPR